MFSNRDYESDLDDAKACPACGSSDTEMDDGKLHCNRCEADPRWHETYDNVTTLGAALLEAGFTAVQLQAYYEKPWKWQSEWDGLKRERLQEVLESVPGV